MAATVITPGQLAGATVFASAPQLPAATTTMASWARASEMADAYSGRQLFASPVPSETLITLAGVGLGGTPGTLPPAAQRMPSAASVVQPPHWPITRTGWMWTPG